VETPFIPPKTTANGRGPRRRERLSIFCGIESGVNPGTTLSHAERLERSHGARNVTCFSNPDCREERFDTDDVHHAREVVGEHEFAIVKAELGGPVNLVSFVENIQRAIRTSVSCCGHEVMTDASIGIAIAPDDGNNLDLLVKSADLAMYDAKSSGRRTYRFFTAEMGARMRARRALELDLRQAIIAGDFEVHYQPLVDLASDAVTALLRWNHRERGLVSPAEFIPLPNES
jgi:predicted signal transduction protein with EAL and GGDEF domain